MGKTLSKKSALIFLCTLFLLMLLCGCERYLENQRIWKEAERVAEKRAVAYIREKYGIEATPNGYNTQGRQSVFEWYANTNVLVYMSYGEERFTVGVDVDDKSILSDNRQSSEICAVLMNHFSDLYSLPIPERSEVRFRIRGIPVYEVSWKSEYSADNLVNFTFENQTAEELLEQIEDISYWFQYSDFPHSLEEIAVKPEDWPKQEDFGIAVQMYLCRDKGVEIPYNRSTEPPFSEKRHLLEWLYTSIDYWDYDDSSAPEIRREFHSYQLAALEGLEFITQLPYKPTETDELPYRIEVSDEVLVWQKQYAMADKSTLVMEFEQISKLFEEVDLSATRCTTQIIIPEKFAEESGNELYWGILDKETGKMIVDEVERGDEKRHMIKNMALGRQYALLKKVAQYTIAASSSGD